MSRHSENSIRVLAAGRAAQVLADLEQALGDQQDVEFTVKQIVNGTVDPLQGVREIPDVLILHLSDNWKGELAA